MNQAFLLVLVFVGACTGEARPDMCSSPLDSGAAHDAAVPPDMSEPACLPPGAACDPSNMPPCCDGIACPASGHCLTYDLR